MTSPMLHTVKGVYNTVKLFEPEQFLSASADVSAATLRALKNLYDYTKDAETEAGDLHDLTTISFVASRTKKKRKLATKAAMTEAPLRQLITESFDSEQIWQEVQLQNGLLYENLVSSISKLLAHAKSLQTQSADLEAIRHQSPRKAASRVHTEIDFDEESDDSEIEFEGNTSRKRKKNDRDSKSNSKANVKVYSKSQVDDKFFNLAQMTEFLEKVESEMDNQGNDNKGEDFSGSESGESIDLFAAMDDDDEGEGEGASDIYFDQFFDQPLDSEESGDTVARETKDDGDKDDDDLNEDDDDDDDDINESQGMLNLEPADSSSSEEDDEPKLTISSMDSQSKPVSANLSSFEKRRKTIEASIDQMEQEALEPKGWQYQGEVTAEKRPENSLLQEHLVFDHLLRQAPEITVKTTLKLEDIMKQRIKDLAWDDVERKAKPKETAPEYKNKLMLDSEKSKQSLAQVYEQEYINKQKTADGANAVETVPEDEAEIQKNLKILFAKLDALSNFHYTPKPAVSDIKIVTNLPSIAMEEVLPVSVSDATLLAPREIQAPLLSSTLKGTGERDETDKKRDRRQKKKKQHLKRVDRDEKARLKGLGLRNVKLAKNIVTSSKKKGKKGDDTLGNVVIGDGKSKELKSSRAFFDKLQDKVQTQIKDKLTKKSKDKKNLPAKRFKL